jgi:hypothetical protein
MLLFQQKRTGKIKNDYGVAGAGTPDRIIFYDKTANLGGKLGQFGRRCLLF